MIFLDRAAELGRAPALRRRRRRILLGIGAIRNGRW